MLHWGSDYRIEEYIESRTPSMFELSNPYILKAMMSAIRGLNESELLRRTMVEESAPSILNLLKNDWIPKSIENWPNLEEYMKGESLEIAKTCEEILKDPT